MSTRAPHVFDRPALHFLTGVHSYDTGEHLLWQRTSLFKDRCRVPLLIVAPHLTQDGPMMAENVAATPVSFVHLRRETWEPSLFIPGGGT